MDTVTLYITQSNAIRKTADNCRRIISLFDALRIKYDKQIIDTKEMMAMITELSGSKELPQTFVGDQFLGTYATVFELNEKQSLATEFRRLGYAGEVVGGENIPVATTEPQVIKKKVVVKKTKPKKPKADGTMEEDDPDAPPPPPDSDEGDDDGDAPPPPPDSDDDEGGAAAAGGEAPPPPPDDDEELPPPPPDDDDE